MTWDYRADSIKHEVEDALHNERSAIKRIEDGRGASHYALNIEMMAVHAARAKCEWVWAVGNLMRWVNGQ